MKTIEVYVKSEEQLKPPPNGNYSDYTDHPCQAKHNITKCLSSSDNEALKMLERMAKEKGAIVKVYDVSTMKGKLKALMKGIKKMPSTVIGVHKIHSIPTEEELRNLL